MLLTADCGRPRRAAAGTPPVLAAAHAGIPTAELIDATERYQAAGRVALIRPGTQEWYQINVEFPDPHTAERSEPPRVW